MTDEQKGTIPVMTITHYDLFAGIGGFSLALEEVFTDATIRHIFCEWESFPTSVLRRHWPDSEFYGDIADLVKHTDNKGLEKPGQSGQQADETKNRTGLDNRPERSGEHADTDTVNEGLEGSSRQRPGHAGLIGGEGANQTPDGFTIVTGGFPCQPFSHAGRRKGTADDRYQWPNMFAVIRNTKPEWVIAENVRGLVTWNDGLVLETVCTDLESEGYEVQPFIIPAVAVGAPHRRDRVWIIGRNTKYAEHDGFNGTEDREGVNKGDDRHPAGQDELIEPAGSDSLWQGDADVSPDAHGQRVSDGLSQVQDPDGEVSERHNHAEPGDTGGHADTDSEHQRQAQRQHEGRPRREETLSEGLSYPDWSRNWQEVAFATCDDAVDDGLSRLVDGVPMSRSKWRQNSLKAYGNGIVTQVAMEIMRAIKTSR